MRDGDTTGVVRAGETERADVDRMGVVTRGVETLVGTEVLVGACREALV